MTQQADILEEAAKSMVSMRELMENLTRKERELAIKEKELQEHHRFLERKQAELDKQTAMQQYLQTNLDMKITAAFLATFAPKDLDDQHELTTALLDEDHVVGLVCPTRLAEVKHYMPKWWYNASYLYRALQLFAQLDILEQTKVWFSSQLYPLLFTINKSKIGLIIAPYSEQDEEDDDEEDNDEEDN